MGVIGVGCDCVVGGGVEMPDGCGDGESRGDSRDSVGEGSLSRSSSR